MPSVHSAMPLLLCIWSLSTPAAAKFSAGAGVDAHRGAHYIQAAHHRTGSHGAARTDGSLAGGAPPPGRGIHGDRAAVGSRTLSRRLSTPVSPATVRNVMADLEDAGLLYAPHVSAGRLPTQMGLRIYVDGLLELAVLPRTSAPASRGSAGRRAHGRGDADRDHRGALGPLGLRRARARAPRPTCPAARWSS